MSKHTANPFGKEDLRVKKTRETLIRAFNALLSTRRFHQLTVNELCEEAFISRATFYSHFNGKYDLLEYWLKLLRNRIICDVYNYEDLERNVNQFVAENQKVISNILKDADNEVLELLYDFMLSIVKLSLKRTVSLTSPEDHVILINFCVGGLTHSLLWLVKNNFPSNISMMNPYLYKMLENITIWDAEMGKHKLLPAQQIGPCFQQTYPSDRSGAL